MLGPSDGKRGITRQVKYVLNLMSELGQPLTADEISQRADLKGDKAAFFDALAKSTKIDFDGCRYTYKPHVFSRDRLDMIRLRRAIAEAKLSDEEAAAVALRRRRVFVNQDQPLFKFSVFN